MLIGNNRGGRGGRYSRQDSDKPPSGRGRGRGGMTLMQRLQAQSPSSGFPDDDDDVVVDAERSPMLSLPSAPPRFSSEEPEVVAAQRVCSISWNRMWTNSWFSAS